MLKLKRNRGRLTIETAVALVEWDAARGGQITQFAVKDELAAHPLLAGGVWPDFAVELAGGRRLRLSETRARIENVAEGRREISFRVRSTLGDGELQVEQEYEIFPEGAIFCQFSVTAPSGRPVRLREAQLAFPADLRAVRNVRWSYVSRRASFMRDATRIHAFAPMHAFLAPSESADEPELLPLVGLDLGWPPARLFSNHVEFILEDAAPLGDGPLENTRTLAGDSGDGWRVQWHLWTKGEWTLEAGRRYGNRWGILFGAARTRARAAAEPARRNNLLGARVAHMGIPYLRRRHAEWPERLLQEQQGAERPSYVTGMPRLSLADDLARAGADTLMIHQGWMSNPGTNCEPPADYHAADPAWLRAFVGRCHARGLRVGLYMRGCEMYAMYSSFFEDFLERDRDGLYVDWSCPLAIGWAKASPIHFSAYGYFHFTRALRKRVGEGGFLEAHSGPINTLLAVAAFDRLISGEAAIQRAALLDNPEACGHFGLIGGVAPVLLFNSERATSFSAALGVSTKLHVGRTGIAPAQRANLEPLWTLLKMLQRPARLYSEAAGTDAVQTRGSDDVYSLIYEDARRRRLLIVTNLGATPCGPVEVRVDRDALRLARAARIELVSPKGAARVQQRGDTLCLEGLPPLAFLGARVG